jgi:hypothetical protein
MSDNAVSRRGFMAGMSRLGLGSTLLPGVLWSQMAAASAGKVTAAMIKDAAKLSGLELTDDESAKILESVNGNLNRIVALHEIEIPNDVAPPFYFSPVTPGMQIDRTARPFKASKPRAVKRPANLEHAAFWPVTDLAELLRTRAVTSTELTRMYLARLHAHNEKLNCVVTFLDDVALAQAAKADAEIAAGRYKGPLHGIPWGAKDIMSFKGHKTTWGSGAYQEQVLDTTATVIELLENAGAVLLAKLTTGELAGGDQWFGGRTNNPWNLEQGSSGSSAGSAANPFCKLCAAIAVAPSRNARSPRTARGAWASR